jgi:hypothetical protein
MVSRTVHFLFVIVVMNVEGSTLLHDFSRSNLLAFFLANTLSAFGFGFCLIR